MQQTIYDMVTMSIQIVPVIDDYITNFMSLDNTIPKMFTKTMEIISEYLKKNSKVCLNLSISNNKWIKCNIFNFYIFPSIQWIYK